MMKKIYKLGILAAIILSTFQLYTGVLGSFTPMVQRGIHLFLVLFLAVFLFKKKTRVDVIALLLTIVLAIMILPGFTPDAQYQRGALGPTQWEIVSGWGLIILVLFVTQRVLGWPIVAVAITFIVYAFVSPYLPGILFHTGVSLSDLSNHLVWTTEGIFGLPLGVSATFVALFILFGVLLEETGAGKFFIDVSYAVAGRIKGGPAQTAIVSSALMGSISGSAVSNVVTTGNITIPLMKKSGYTSRMAGAIESVASTGGQITPPVMGAVAFVMADMTGIPYATIVLAAIIPALLFYISLGTNVYLEANKLGLEGLKKEELPQIKEVMKKGFYLTTPIIVLIICIVGFQYSPTKSAVYTIAVTALILIMQGWFREKQFPIRSIVRALKRGGEMLVPVATACATAGIVIGVVGATSLGVRFSQSLIDLSGGHIWLVLLLMMIACLILGMGLPTTAAYIITAVLGAKALVELGVPLIAAHMFILYFAILSFITPPVSIAAFAAAGIAESDPIKTGFSAWRLGLAGFIIPYMFVSHPAILGQGSLLEVTFYSIVALLGVVSLAVVMNGWCLTQISVLERAIWLLAAILLLIPETITSVIGLSLFAIGLFIQFRRKKEKLSLAIQHTKVN